MLQYRCITDDPFSLLAAEEIRRLVFQCRRDTDHQIASGYFYGCDAAQHIEQTVILVKSDQNRPHRQIAKDVILAAQVEIIFFLGELLFVVVKVAFDRLDRFSQIALVRLMFSPKQLDLPFPGKPVQVGIILNGTDQGLPDLLEIHEL